MYSSADDMISQFGVVEMTRLTTPSGQPLVEPNRATIEAALTQVSAIIDSYLRRRYQTPVAASAPELDHMAAHKARYDLALGDARQPSQQMIDENRDAVNWLKSVRDGTVLLDLAVVPSSTESHAAVQTRDEAFGSDVRRVAGWGGVG